MISFTVVARCTAVQYEPKENGYEYNYDFTPDKNSVARLGTWFQISGGEDPTLFRVGREYHIEMRFDQITRTIEEHTEKERYERTRQILRGTSLGEDFYDPTTLESERPKKGDVLPPPRRSSGKK